MTLSVLAVIFSFVALLKIFKHLLVMVSVFGREGMSPKFIFLFLLLIIFLAMLYYGVDNLIASLGGVGG